MNYHTTTVDTRINWKTKERKISRGDEYSQIAFNNTTYLSIDQITFKSVASYPNEKLIVRQKIGRPSGLIED